MKKPKKKKKKMKVATNDNNNRETEEEKEIQEEISSKQQQQKKRPPSFYKDLEVVRQQEGNQGEIDWDAITKQNAAKFANKANLINEEEEKEDNERRKRVCSYKEITKYFISEVDLKKEIELIQGQKEDFSRIGFFERLASCFAQPRLLNNELSAQRDILFALSRVKLDTSIAEHEILLKTIYKKLTSSNECRLIGSHWVDIGFQGSDPKTDIRGAGVLGLIHILYFIDNFKQTSQLILKYSQTEKVEFPLVVKMFEFTVIVIRLMREGRLYNLCNQNRNVFETASDVYQSLFQKFINIYVRGNHNITHMDDLNQQIDKAARSNIANAIGGYTMISDFQALKLLQETMKQKSLQQKEKLQQMTQSQPVYQVQEVKFVNKQQANVNNKQSEGQARRGNNYATADDEGATDIKKDKLALKSNDKGIDEEFSRF